MRAVVLSLGLVACGIPVVGSGELATEERAADGFRAVRSTSSIDVDIVEGPPGVTVTCDDNLLEYLVTRIDGDTLVLRTATGVSVSPNTDCFFVVSAPDLDRLENTGSAHVRAEGAFGLRDVRNTGSGVVDVDEIDGGPLEIRLTGSGRVAVFGGAVDALDIESTGSGHVDTVDLEARDASVRVSGSGTVELTATRSVDVKVTGSGEVIVNGDPEHVERTVTGSGSITVR